MVKEITNFSELNKRISKKIKDKEQVSEIYYYQPKSGDSLYLDGDKFFNFTTKKPNKEMSSSPVPDKGEYTEYKFFDNSGVIVILFPKCIKSINKIKEEIFSYCKEKFGNNLSLDFGSSYREIDGYYRTNVYINNDLFTLIDSPFDGVAIGMYYGPHSLINSTKEVLTDVAERGAATLIKNDGVSISVCC